ncbi:MAG TPA: hypothetical protein DEB46_14385 [Myxococcales bacterium]|nr:hypothetical protein [Myxococcales bacterium]
MERSGIDFQPLVGSTSLIFLGLCALLALYWSWRSSLGLRGRQRGILMGLRALLIVGVLITLTGPSLRKERVRRIPGKAVVLVDRSASMGVADRQKAISELLEPEKIERLSKDYRLQFQGFSDGLEGLDPTALPPAEGRDTDVLGALEAMKSHLGEQPVAGIALISDGVDRRGSFRRPEAEQRLKALALPVTVLLPGEAMGKDGGVELLDPPKLAFVRNTFDVTLRLRARGLAGERLQLSHHMPGVERQSQWVEIESDRFEKDLKVPIKPVRVGRQVLTVELSPTLGERQLQNNRLEIPLQVVRDRLRVLQVAGEPTWDVRFLRRLLKEDPGIDLISFFILRTHGDSNAVPEQELSLIPFPERELFVEQLHTFDVVIFQDFDFAPYSVGRYLRHVRDFVLENGGGFVMVGGPRSFTEGGYSGTPVAEILPVELAAGPADQRFFHPRVSAEGHPILDLRPGQPVQGLLDGLPLLAGHNRLGRPKPGSTVLLVHPEHSETRPEPIMVASRMGRGRSLAIAVDSLWNWQLPAAEAKAGSRPYYRFWHKALRWLAGDLAYSRLQWSGLPERHPSGEPLRFRLGLKDPQWKPQAGGQIELVLEHKHEAKRVVEEQTDTDGWAGFQIKDLSDGVWSLKAVARAEGAEVAQLEGVVLVGALGPERRQLGPNTAVANAISQATGGKVLNWQRHDLEDVPWRQVWTERVEAVEWAPLWNKPWMILIWLLPGLLGIFLRRRWNLA